MRRDIAIIGGGMAGTTAAAMLGRAGIDAVFVDPHEVYPPDFRCEKLDAMQVGLLVKTGLADVIDRVSTRSSQVWVARGGRLVAKLPSGQIDALYETMVNAMRGAVSGSASFVHAKATGIVTGSDRQTVTLSTGKEISARLVVMANGLNAAVRRNLGFERQVLSPAHSISVGFDIVPTGRARFDFPALTYYAERFAERIAYLTLFPIGSTMRANLFVYRDVRDPWLKALRVDPVEALLAAMPGLANLTGEFDVPGPVHIRPVDLYITDGVRQPGVVLIGDAYSTSCPAAGTGLNKVFVDVERLCNVYIPQWLSTPGMSADKIAAFYADPVKVESEAYCASRARYVRAIAVDRGLKWRARRTAVSARHRIIGALGAAGTALSPAPGVRVRPAIGAGSGRH